MVIAPTVEAILRCALSSVGAGGYVGCAYVAAAVGDVRTGATATAFSARSTSLARRSMSTIPPRSARGTDHHGPVGSNRQPRPTLADLSR